MLALCLILALLPFNTAYADEVDTQDAVYQTEDIQPAEAAAQPEAQSVEVKPEVQPEEAQPEEQPEEVKPEAQPEEAQPEEVKPEETQPEEVKPEAPVEPDQGAAMEEAAEPAEIMLAPAAVSPAASYKILTEIELSFKPVTEITTLKDFEQVTYSPSDKIYLNSVDIREGYKSTTDSTPGKYISDHAYTVMYEFKCKSDAYVFNSITTKVKVNSKYTEISNPLFSNQNTLWIQVSYPSLKNKVSVNFKPRNQWSGSISNMYVGHNLDTKDYSVSVNYYEGLNQTKNAIKPNKEYDSTKDYSVRINIKGKEAGAIISPNLTKKDVTINEGTIWKVTRDDDSTGYTRIYVNFPKDGSNTEYTVQAKNAVITDLSTGKRVSKAKARTRLQVKLVDFDQGYTFEKWVVDDNSTDVEFIDAKSTTATFFMPEGEVYISPATLRIVYVYSKKLTYNGKEQTGVSIADKYGNTSVATLTGHRATEVGTYTATASLKEGYSWSDGTTGNKNIVWRIDKANRNGPGNLTVVRPTKEGVNDGRIVNTTTEKLPSWRGYGIILRRL